MTNLAFTNTWSKSEDQALLDGYGKVDAKVLALRLGRSTEAVFHRAARIGAVARRRWTAADDQELRALWGEKSLGRIARELGRTVTTTYWREGSRKGILGLEQPPPAVAFARLADRLRRVLIACGDWSALVTPSALGFNTTGTTPVAVFADPPYPDEAVDYGAAPDVAQRVAEWCRANGDDPRLRIALCGHIGDYDLPGWTTLEWGASRGWGREKRGANECVWLSPHCLPLEQQRTLFDRETA